MTRTYTRYFTDESEGIIELGVGVGKLVAHFERRRPHISEDAAHAIERRLDVLRSAVGLLLEPVPSAFE